MKQRTLKGETTVQGIGLHTGRQVTLTFKPAPIGHGFKFQRTLSLLGDARRFLYPFDD